MHRLLLLAALASACDQGATASPPPSPPVPLVVSAPMAPMPPMLYERYAVRDDADFVAKVRVMLAEMVQVFDGGAQGCDRLATRIDLFGGENVTRFAVLTAYGKAHPALENKLESLTKPEIDGLIKVMTTSLAPCMTDRRVTTALQKFSELANLPQQRPG